MSSTILASEFVTDTMGLVLRLEQRRLGSTAKTLFEKLLKNPPSTLRQAQDERRKCQIRGVFPVRAEPVEARFRVSARPLRNLSTASEAMEAGTAIIRIPAIVLAEILYLSEKKRISLTLRSVEEYLARFPNCRELPLSFGVMQAAAEITDIPELHDRLIAATAQFRNVELITNDLVIQTSAFVRTIW